MFVFFSSSLLLFFSSSLLQMYAYLGEGECDVTAMTVDHYLMECRNYKERKKLKKGGWSREDASCKIIR
jgi:hypothetical protein